MNAFHKFVFVCAVFFLASCGNYFDRSSGGTSSESFTNSGVDFALVQMKIFGSRCVSCHQQYGNYGGVRRELSSISSAINSDRMPKVGGPLSSSLKQLLAMWVARGAPEFAGQTPPPVEPVELKPIWQSVYDHIISSRCLVCHNPNGQAKLFDLSRRNVIFATRDRVFGDGKKLIDFENPDRSYLIEVVEDEREPMPPVASGIRRLSREEIDVLKEWIRLELP